jgi:serine/threonine protein kinase
VVTDVAPPTIEAGRIRVPLSLGYWVHVVGTYSTETNTQALYLNGKLYTSQQRQADMLYSFANPLWVGRFYDVVDDNSANALIDGVRLWDRNFTADEIWDLYANPQLFQATPSNGLLAAWSMDEGSGLVANDVSGNNHTIYWQGMANDTDWIPQNCSVCDWCVPTATPYTPSTESYKFAYTYFNWTEPENDTLIPIVQPAPYKLSIGFNFTYFGKEFDTIWMDGSGLLMFYPTQSTCLDSSFFQPGAPLQNSINVLFARYGTGTAYATTIGPPGQQVFIATWVEWISTAPAADATMDNKTFQAKLYEGTNRMEFHYKKMSGSAAFEFGGQATVGLCEAAGYAVAQTDMACILHSWNEKVYPSESALIICNTADNDPVCNGTGTSPPFLDGASFQPAPSTSSTNDALIGGLVGGLGGALVLVVLATVIGLWAGGGGYWFYMWRRKRVPYFEEEMERHTKFEKPYREIDWNELELEELLGAGAFGKVYKAKWRKAVVAVKVCTDMDLDLKNDEVLDEIRQEASLMEHLGHHPNIISFLGACTEGEHFALVTEYCAYGSLYDLLISGKTKPSQEVDRELILKMLRGAARGIMHLHQERVVHRDISARNVLVAKDFTVRISDFGLSRLRDDSPKNYGTTKSNIGPVRWMAPEAITHRKYSEKSDAWSFGVLIWELVTRKEPWEGVSLLEIALGVGKKGWRLKIPKECDPMLTKLMKDCWKTEPALRPSFPEIERRLSEELGDDEDEHNGKDPDDEDGHEESVPDDMQKRNEYEMREIDLERGDDDGDDDDNPRDARLDSSASSASSSSAEEESESSDSEKKSKKKKNKGKGK